MTKESLKESIEKYFGQIPDKRVVTRSSHKLIDIVAIAILGVLCGADGWVGIETYGKAKEEWLKSFLELPNGIPSHVSAWSCSHRLVLGQVAVKQKSNEITAIPLLLEQLDLKSGIITIDAMGTQTAIAKQIKTTGADYILALKNNHPSLAEEAKNWFQKNRENHDNQKIVKTELICEAEHHRLEKRRFWQVPAEEVFSKTKIAQWVGLETLVIEESSRTLWNKTTYSERFFLSSLSPKFPNFPTSIRSHWGIENQLHWCLDVIFAEDDSRIRKDNAPRNMTLLRRLALNLLRQDTSKGSLKMKRYRAGLDNNFLLQLLSHSGIF